MKKWAPLLSWIWWVYLHACSSYLQIEVNLKPIEWIIQQLSECTLTEKLFHITLSSSSVTPTPVVVCLLTQGLVFRVQLSANAHCAYNQ